MSATSPCRCARSAISRTAIELRPRPWRSCGTMFTSAQSTFAPPSSNPRAIAPSIPCGRWSRLPSQRTGIRACAGEDLVAIVHVVELELGPLLGQSMPAAVVHVAVVVVLRQDVARSLPGRSAQVRSLGDCQSLHRGPDPTIRAAGASGDRRGRARPTALAGWPPVRPRGRCGSTRARCADRSRGSSCRSRRWPRLGRAGDA
jgi:hypothetical protein